MIGLKNNKCINKIQWRQHSLFSAITAMPILLKSLQLWILLFRYFCLLFEKLPLLWSACVYNVNVHTQYATKYVLHELMRYYNAGNFESQFYLISLARGQTDLHLNEPITRRKYLWFNYLIARTSKTNYFNCMTDLKSLTFSQWDNWTNGIFFVLLARSDRDFSGP